MVKLVGETVVSVSTKQYNRTRFELLKISMRTSETSILGKIFYRTIYKQNP